MPTKNTIECEIIISHHGAPLKEKYGITVERLAGNKTLGSNIPTHLRDDSALFTVLFGLGYSALEIAQITRELEKRGSSYKDERLIEESSLTTNGF